MAKDLAELVLMRVKEIRIVLDLTQEEFAKKSGFKYKYYQKLEAGRRMDFRFSTLERLAKACRLAPWELLKFERKPKQTKERVRH